MTIKEAIDMVDKLKPNIIPRADKVQWLSDIDGKIYQEILLLHQRNAGEPELPQMFVGYTDETPEDTELFVPEPHTAIYRYQLEANIDLTNAELAKYNNAAALLSNALQAFSASYTRTHMPVQRVRFLKI